MKNIFFLNIHFEFIVDYAVALFSILNLYIL